MATKKYPKHIERRAFLHAIPVVDGWVLVARDDDAKNWHIAWLEVFYRKGAALAFATENDWQKPFRAVRASLAVTIR